jgi:hypothetical protein
MKPHAYMKCAICNDVYGEKAKITLACLHKFHTDCVVKKGK